MHQLHYTGLDLPLFDPEAVTYGHNNALKAQIDALRASQVTGEVDEEGASTPIDTPSTLQIIREVDLDWDSRLPPSPLHPLLHILDIVDAQLQIVDEMDPTILSVVDHEWGLTRDIGFTQRNYADSDPGCLVPKGHLLVARVDLVNPGTTLMPAEENAVLSLFNDYYNNTPDSERILSDLRPDQCVVDDLGGLVLVDIEPRLHIKKNYFGPGIIF